MGKKMYELSNEPKYFYSQEYGDHMVNYDEKLLLEIPGLSNKEQSQLHAMLNTRISELSK